MNPPVRSSPSSGKEAERASSSVSPSPQRSVPPPAFDPPLVTLLPVMGYNIPAGGNNRSPGIKRCEDAPGLLIGRPIRKVRRSSDCPRDLVVCLPCVGGRPPSHRTTATSPAALVVRARESVDAATAGNATAHRPAPARPVGTAYGKPADGIGGPSLDVSETLVDSAPTITALACARRT